MVTPGAFVAFWVDAAAVSRMDPAWVIFLTSNFGKPAITSRAARSKPSIDFL